ncbi:MAG: plastocyanin/azurin family copper-binding protein [Bacteroidota bacterium]
MVRTLLALLFLPLVACGSSDQEAIPDQTAVFAESVDVELVVAAERNAMAFAVERIEAPAGARVRLVMDNTETTSRAMVHNIVVVNNETAIDRVGNAAVGAPQNVPDDPGIVAYTPLAGPGERVAVVFEMPPVGEYPFICTFPGHHQFMQGVLVSTAAEAQDAASEAG